ncbi:hypothetical protein A3K02_00150 [candidate division WS6 bacterium RIFOXYD1_FULL_33_8]|uniref:Excinuclease ABC C subunit domain protein n=2 Tax=Candidatus Dojkabacteria TaxID=74243 RepID=A0A0G0AEW9_9BACT|nr:MAG: excinuclease ABC subunit C, excinuclease ABC subunit C [candidate division WS6 bacterium GW2011_GWE2_33_157]KKP44199.1 MAG: excinuclease ABC subunit C, excinuclease ABC subunit C [candidate division WS6 bacterium GW2011_GWC1_33_20]KKP45745.1 MAG: excinuclease ABC subunit C, excinuclease ABC subunit C [candidate division WS6 bacterium GW2011_GWF1_33_233]KKP55093.1 MAG: Excinuclease ABC C subunit domain protein [candidate division WS6 bacterium GW2011_GWB1_33_6]KKP55188.1 MAG: excinucleas
MNSSLERKIEVLPELPGVYKFLDSKGEILYIGKAINLRKRVTSYFSKELNDRPRIRQMMPLVKDISITEANNEIEALILESALIRRLQPQFNSALKDDKSYAWIYISTKEKFPTVKIVRSTEKGEYKNGKLFGPYPSGFTIKRVYTYLRKLYPFCTCKNKDCASSLYFHIGLCPGPYIGAISEEDYRKNINSIIKFLQGKKENHIKRLEKEMNIYSRHQEYEKASQLRDRIKDLRYIGESIDFTYYDEALSYETKRESARKKSFEYLATELGMENLKRIECYDISNIQGKHAYGSMVVAVDGKLERSHYRIFKIRGGDNPNDPAMLTEVLQRRFNNLQKTYDESLSSIPDLLLIDGGKGQLSVVKEYIPNSIYLMGISKGKHFKRAGLLLKDEFWFVKDGEILQTEILNPEILIDLRNEAHRFAITHYRKQSIKQSKMSILDEIDGIGTKRRKELLTKFKSVDGIKKAKEDEIYEVIKNRVVVKKIIEKLTNL